MRKLLVDQDEFRAQARRGVRRPDAVFRVSTGAKAIDGTRKIRFCFSDGSVDRVGDRIDPNGWVLEDFLKNPVALWAHDSYSPPIGRASRVQVENQRLMGDIEFASVAAYPFADTIYELIKGGFINAVSVGFLPIKYSFVEDKDRPWGIDFEKTELLEISVVPIPANASALIEARAAGINTAPLLRWAERVQPRDPARGERIRIANSAAAHARAMRTVAAAEAGCARVERTRRAERAQAEARRVLARKG